MDSQFILLTVAVIIIGCVQFGFVIYWFRLKRSKPQIESKSENPVTNAPEKYKGSPIDQSLAETLMANVVDYVEKNEPFLDNELSLKELAALVGMNSHYLSQVINQQSDMNFYEFINSYRAKHAASLLAGSEKTNITKIAFDSGFNNRVSFTNAFKKQFNSTPSEYREIMKKNMSD